MSDFLVNLARRSAGLAPVVRARTAPAVLVDPDSSAGTAPERHVVSRGGAESAEDGARSVAPGAQAGGVMNAAPTISPAPVVRVTPQVVAPAVQRVPVASAAPAPVSALTAARGGDAPSVAPRTAPRSAEPATVIVPAATAIASVPSVPRDDAPRTREMHDEPRTIETRTQTVVRTESPDAPVPVVVTIEPAERAATAAPAPRTEPAPERTVHVRIGAIEIFGAEPAAQQQPVAAAPLATAPATAPASQSGGFDEYSALRSYAPWAW